MNKEQKEALGKAMNLCSRQEKCRSDIRKKLFDWGIEEEDMQVIIDELEKEKFVDEARYSAFYARDKFRFNKWGKIKIAFTLREKGIPSHVVEEAFTGLDGEEYREMVISEMKKKLKSISGLDRYERKSKALLFAQSRGYEMHLIMEADGDVFNEEW